MNKKLIEVLKRQKLEREGKRKEEIDKKCLETAKRMIGAVELDLPFSMRSYEKIKEARNSIEEIIKLRKEEDKESYGFQSISDRLSRILKKGKPKYEKIQKRNKEIYELGKRIHERVHENR